MGREIRRVPPNWEHPKETEGRNAGHYIAMYDHDFDTALKEWLDGYELWKKGEHPEQVENPKRKTWKYWEWKGGPPDPETCRPAFTEEPTWYQIYETVSEGTPVTPPFATKAELVDYLVKHGDFWDQQRGQGGWSRENAEGFVEREWAPSLAIFRDTNGTSVLSPRDGI